MPCLTLQVTVADNSSDCDYMPNRSPDPNLTLT